MEDQFDPWPIQDRYDLLFLEFKGICLELEWRITTMSLIYFRWFELTASGGVKYGTTFLPPCAAEFCTFLFTVIFTNNGFHGEKLQRFCLQ